MIIRTKSPELKANEWSFKYIQSIDIEPGTDQIDTHFRFAEAPELIYEKFFTSEKNKSTLSSEMQQWLDGMETIDLPSEVSVEVGAIEGCKNLKWIDLSKVKTGRYFPPFEITNRPNEIPEKCFSGCSSLVRVIFSAGIQAIGTEAFKNCTASR